MANRTADDDRCARSDGKKWRCSLPRIGGSRFCEKHHHYYLQMNAKVKARARVSNPKTKKEKGLAQGAARVRVSSTLPELKKKMKRRRVRVSEPTIAKKEMPIGDDDLGIRVRISTPMEKTRKVGRLPKTMKERGVNDVSVSIVKKEMFVGANSRVRVCNPLVENKRKRDWPSNKEKNERAFRGSDPLIVKKERPIEEEGNGAWVRVSSPSLETKKKHGRPSKKKEKANSVRISEPSIMKKEMPTEEDGNVADRVRASNPTVETKKKRGKPSKNKDEANSVRVSEPLIMKTEMPIEEDGNGTDRVRVSNPSLEMKKKRGTSSKKKEEASSVSVSEPSIMKKEMPIEEDDFVTRIRVSNPSIVRKKRSRPSNAKKKDMMKFVGVSDLTGKKCSRTLKTNMDEGKKSVRNEIKGEEDEESLRVLELGQVWAFPKGSDGFPRYYARIDRIVVKSTGTIAMVTELVPQPVSVEEIIFVEQGLSLGCGQFSASQSTIGVNIFDFTHKVLFEKEENEGSLYKIFPKTGEIWAVYFKWDNLKKGFEYKLVEVVSDFNEKGGVNVFGLVLAEGRDGVYRRQVRQGFYMIRNFLRSFMPVFSHRVPASRIIEDGDIIWKVMLH